MMTFQFAKDSMLLPAHLFAFRHFGWTAFEIDLRGGLVIIELYQMGPDSDSVNAYKLGQIVGCAVKDLTALMVKYESPSISERPVIDQD